MNTSQTRMPVLGIDLGGTNMQLGLVDGSNTIVARAKRKTQATQGTDAVIGRIVEGCRELCETAGLTFDDIGALGIAAAGAIDIPNGVVLNAPNLRWFDLPLRDILREKTGRPVVVENDVNGAVWGEYLQGAGRGGENVLGVWIGTGVGGGLVLGGRLYYGDFFTAGEFGHMIVDTRAPRGFARIEDRCSRTGMSRAIVARRHAYPESILHDLNSRGGGIIGSKILKDAVDAEDELALDIVSEAAELLGKSIASVVTLLAINRVIVGGGITEALGEAWLDRIRASFDQWVFPERSRACRIVATELRDDAGLLGAALLARASIEIDA